MQLKNSLILVGTFWPVIGPFLAVFIGLILAGWKRWIMLSVGPILFLSPCYFYAGQIGYNGNMLFVALMGIAYLFLLIYYPTLLIAGVVSIYTSRKPDQEDIE